MPSSHDGTENKEVIYHPYHDTQTKAVSSAAVQVKGGRYLRRLKMLRGTDGLIDGSISSGTTCARVQTSEMLRCWSDSSMNWSIQHRWHLQQEIAQALTFASEVVKSNYGTSHRNFFSSFTS